MPLVSPIDVLTNYFGELPGERALAGLTVARMEELGGHLVQSASASLADPVPPGTYYPGGWLGAGWSDTLFSDDLHLSLLYYPRLLVHDPLSGYFFNQFSSIPEMRSIRYVDPLSRREIGQVYGGPDIYANHSLYVNHRDDPVRSVEWFKGLIRSVISFAPLIDGRILILRDQWPTILDRSQSIITSVRHDVKSAEMNAAAESSPEETTLWDNIKGMKVSINGGVPHPADDRWRNQAEFFYLAKTLAVADESGATYVPPTDADFGLVRAKATANRHLLNTLEKDPSRILKEVARLTIPDLRMDPKLTIKLREDEGSFDSWRRDLSALARASADDEDYEMAARVNDMMIPRIREIERGLNKSSALRDNLLPDGTEMAIAAGLGLAASGGVGALAAVPGAIGWLIRGFQRPRLSGSDTVLARLVRNGKQKSDKRASFE